MTNQLKLILAGLTFALFIGYTLYVYNAGKHSCETAQLKAQIQQDTKVKKKYDKIDKQTPTNGDKRTAIDWLYNYGSK